MANRTAHIIGAGMLTALAVTHASCVAPEDACGPLQELRDGVCECVEGAVVVEGACVTCGENEAALEGVCACVDGYYRAVPGEPCVEVPAALGMACGGDGDCDDPLVTYCAGADGGYCTLSDCQSSADCIGGYACNTLGATSFCERPPSGLGTPCSQADDCSAYDASFCDTFNRLCLVPDCSLSNNDCFEGWICCDFTDFPFGETPDSLCVQEDAGCPDL